jgi:hypothetical protein
LSALIPRIPPRRISRRTSSLDPDDDALVVEASGDREVPSAEISKEQRRAERNESVELSEGPVGHEEVDPPI